MGAVFAHRKIYDAFMQGPENAIEAVSRLYLLRPPRRLRRRPGDARGVYQEGLLTRAASLAPEVVRTRCIHCAVCRMCSTCVITA